MGPVAFLSLTHEFSLWGWPLVVNPALISRLEEGDLGILQRSMFASECRQSPYGFMTRMYTEHHGNL